MAFLCHPDDSPIGQCHISDDRHVKKLQIWRWNRSHPLNARSHQLPPSPSWQAAFSLLITTDSTCTPFITVGGSDSWSCSVFGEVPVVKWFYKWQSRPLAPGTGVPPAWPLAPNPVCPLPADGCGCCLHVQTRESWMCIPKTHVDARRTLTWLATQTATARCCLQQHLHAGLLKAEVWAGKSPLLFWRWGNWDMEKRQEEVSMCRAALKGDPESCNKTMSKGKRSAWSAKSPILTYIIYRNILLWSGKDKHKWTRGVVHEGKESTNTMTKVFSPSIIQLLWK